MEKLKSLILKYCEPITYVITGGVTTGVNFGVYFILTRIGNVYYLAAEIFAWIAAVVFAFIVNKIIVFKDKNFKGAEIFPQFFLFALLRAASLLAEMVFMYILVDFARMNDGAVKIGAGVFIVIVNYIFSKFIIFKK